MGSHSDPKNQTPKAPLHQKKAMLSIWRDWKTILYSETLSSFYPVEILIRMSAVNNWTNWRKKLKKKTPELINRRCVVYHHDNAQPHTSLKTQKKLRELDWEVLPYPPYSPNFTPSNYLLFRILEHYLRGENFESAKYIKLDFSSFLSKKGRNFWKERFKIWVKDGTMS